MIDNKQDSRQIQTASWLAIILVFGEGTEPYLGFRQHDGTGPGASTARSPNPTAVALAEVVYETCIAMLPLSVTTGCTAHKPSSAAAAAIKGGANCQVAGKSNNNR